MIEDSAPTKPSGPRFRLAALAGWLLLCFGAAGMGAAFAPGDWYAALNKPSWNPPGWLFGPVWTVLYAMMATAAWLVWKEGGWNKQREPLLLFLGQLALNALWSPLFFGLQNPAVAFVEIVFLWLAIVATMRFFLPVNRAATLLLAPYLAWVSFASFLNFTIWQLNPVQP